MLLYWFVKVVACGKYGVLVFDQQCVFDQKLICSGYECVRRHGDLQWAV